MLVGIRQIMVVLIDFPPDFQISYGDFRTDEVINGRANRFSPPDHPISDGDSRSDRANYGRANRIFPQICKYLMEIFVMMRQITVVQIDFFPQIPKYLM